MRSIPSASSATATSDARTSMRYGNFRITLHFPVPRKSGRIVRCVRESASACKFQMSRVSGKPEIKTIGSPFEPSIRTSMRAPSSLNSCIVVNTFGQSCRRRSRRCSLLRQAAPPQQPGVKVERARRPQRRLRLLRRNARFARPRERPHVKPARPHARAYVRPARRRARAHAWSRATSATRRRSTKPCAATMR